MKKFTLPRGTADVLPDGVTAWRATEEKSRNLFRCYGFQEIRTPVFEETALFSRSIGQTSDIVQKQMLNLQPQDASEDKEPGVKYSLRPEGTAAVVRSYIQNRIDKKEPLSKLFYIGPMFRGERPQKGRLRQFHQIGAEVIGPQSASPYLDAELIALCVNIIKEIGVKDFALKLNTLGTLEDRKNFQGYLKKKLTPHLDELCNDCRNRLKKNTFRVLDCKNKQCRKVVRALDLSDEWLSAESREYFVRVKSALDTLKINYTVDPHLVRGLDYYTHTVFEVSCPGLGSQDAVGAGGRYNHLVSDLGGPEVDAVGFALGVERLLLSGAGQQGSPAKGLDAYLVVMSEQLFVKGFLLAERLRRCGISCDLNYLNASTKGQLRQANKMNARSAVILGEEEDSRGTVTVKDMKEGTQKEVPVNQIDIKELVSILRERQR